jgi:outer membrane biosynthesis protein TonB
MIADMNWGRSTLARAALGAALLSLMLLASGCTKPVERDDVRVSATPEQERSAPRQPAVTRQQQVVAEKKQKSQVAASKQPEPEPDPVSVEQPAPAPAPAPVHTVSELMGKSEAEVTVLMGTPARVEQRAASTVWVYQGGDCSLDVYFFLDMATSDERVLTVAPTAESATAAAAAETPSAGAPTTNDAANPDNTAEGTVVDACYGKLRRS